MAHLTKRQKAMQGKVADTQKLYAIIDALAIVKECATAKFDESIDVAVQLGIDAKKSDQVVRGAVVLPHGTGKTSASPCLPKAPRLTKPAPPAPTSSAWKTWPNRSRPAS
jgi:large subunit ribosomal protein L1